MTAEQAQVPVCSFMSWEKSRDGSPLLDVCDQPATEQVQTWRPGGWRWRCAEHAAAGPVHLGRDEYRRLTAVVGAAQHTHRQWEAYSHAAETEPYATSEWVEGEFVNLEESLKVLGGALAAYDAGKGG